MKKLFSKAKRTAWRHYCKVLSKAAEFWDDERGMDQWVTYLLLIFLALGVGLLVYNGVTGKVQSFVNTEWTKVVSKFDGIVA